MDGRGDRGESVAIIGMACRFPGARDPAEFHDLAVAGRDMFQPVAALPGRPLRAAVLDDWSAPQIADDPVTGGLWPDVGPVRKLAAEMTALAPADEGPRTHVLAGSTAGVRELTRRAAVLGVPVEVLDGGKGGGRADALPRHGQVRRPAAERVRGHELRPAAPTADLHDHRPPGHRGGRHGAAAGRPGHPPGAVRPGDGAGGRGRRPDRDADSGLMPGSPPGPPSAAACPPCRSRRRLPPGNTDQRGRPGAALTQALAALFTAGALTDLTPFLPAANAGEEGRAREGGTGGGREMSGSTLASRTVPRMRAAEEAAFPGRPPPGRSAAAERETRPVR